MDLVLVACSDSKQGGGVLSYISSNQLAQGLSTISFGNLLNLRSEVVRGSLKPLPIGLDVGIPSAKKAAQYLPAYKRYTGIVYKRGWIQELYPEQSHVHLVIISALYGLLDGDDLIQNYNLKMEDMISGQRLYTWWKHHNLGSIVEEYLLACNPITIHDLLPISYQNALQPWPRAGISQFWNPLDCSGLGQGSSYRRGEYLLKLMSGPN